MRMLELPSDKALVASASAGDTFAAASACSGSLAIVPNGRDSRMAAAVVRIENLDFMVLVAGDVWIAVCEIA
jgi:hypothetical protein